MMLRRRRPGAPFYGSVVLFDHIIEVLLDGLKTEELLPRRIRLRQCKYLNNVLEQDHRTVKKRVWLAKGYGSFRSAWRTLQGIEAVNNDLEGAGKMVAEG